MRGMDLLHSYNDMAGRICKMWRDYSHPVRPYVLTVEAGGRKRCATYPTQAQAEHAAAHFMATGNLQCTIDDLRFGNSGAPEGAQAGEETPALQKAREGVPSSLDGRTPSSYAEATPLPSPQGSAETGRNTGESGIDKNAPKTALPPQGGASTRSAPETHFATPLQRQSGAN